MDAELLLSNMKHAVVITPGKFRELRDLSGLTFEELAQRTGITRSQLVQYEHGLPRLSTAKLIKAVREMRKEVANRIVWSQQILKDADVAAV